MYNIKLYDYVPKPEPAESGRIVAAHYYPSWTKDANGLTHEFSDIADYPERTPLMGYYEDKNPEVIDWEIKWSLEHGINCFIYCWYRRKDNEGKPVTAADLRLGQGLHEGFFQARYNKMMKFAIMYEASPRWGSTDAVDMRENLFPFWMENYFKRENYLVLDNKPVLYVYNPRNIFQAMRVEEQRAMWDACRDAARAHGFDGMYIYLQRPDWLKDMFADAAACGYDGIFRYTACVPNEDLDSETYLNLQLNNNRAWVEAHPYESCATAGVFWDSEPRLKTLPYAGATPSPTAWHYPNTRCYLTHKDYRTLLREVKQMADAAPEDSIAHRVIMLDNFNEWDEGHWLLPSYKFGFKHLQAIREELTTRENLPDYRMPEALGFAPYDGVWGGREIDLSAGNWRKLDEDEFKLYRADGK